MGVQIPHGKGQFWGWKWRPIVKYRDTLQSPVLESGWTDRDAIWIVGSEWPKELWVRWDPDPPTRRGSFGEGASIVKYREFLPWAVYKRLNWSICHLGWGLRLVEGGTSSNIFARWRQCAHMGGYIGATWRIHFNRLSAAALQSYVKSLWPFVKPRLHNTTCCQTGLTNGCIVYTAGCQTGCTTRFYNRVERTVLFVQHGCQTGLYNRFDKHGLTTGCIM